jgi:hypothetical protein
MRRLPRVPAWCRAAVPADGMPAPLVRLALVLCVASACASSGSPRLLAFPDPGIHPRNNVNEIGEYGEAAASVLDVIDRDLEFPPFPIVFQFCPGRRSFEATLLEAGYDRALARDTSRTMQAVGGYRRILINEQALATEPWPSRVMTLAHEVGHSLQYEWGGGRRGASDQWLREGFAEWLALSVIERLHGPPLSAARQRYTTALRRYTPSASRAPALADMVTFRQWVSLSGRPNGTQYAQAFLAVDFLIERHGLAAVLAYFRSFARSNDRAANFRAAFGEDLASFGAAAAARLWR